MIHTVVLCALGGRRQRRPLMPLAARSIGPGPWDLLSALAVASVITAGMAGGAVWADSTTVLLGSSSDGLFYWHGREVRPPYRITAERMVAADTIWRDFRINGFPLIGSLPTQVPPLPPKWIPRLKLQETVMLAAQADLKRGLSRAEMTQRWAERYRARKDLVDSVIVRSETEWLVYWRGESMPVGHVVDLRPAWPPDPKPGRGNPAAAENILKSLRLGNAVVYGEAILTVNAESIDQLQSEIEAIRRGAVLPPQAILSSKMADEFRHPPALPKEGQ